MTKHQVQNVFTTTELICGTTLQTVCTVQKRALRIVNNVGFYDHTNLLFIKSKALKFMDLVDQKTALVMYKARKKLLPSNIQTMFREREGGYALRGERNWKQPICNTYMKSRCVSVCGVKLWNALRKDLKYSKNMLTFKKGYKDMMIDKYRLVPG